MPRLSTPARAPARSAERLPQRHPAILAVGESALPGAAPRGRTCWFAHGAGDVSVSSPSSLECSRLRQVYQATDTKLNRQVLFGR